MDSIIISSSRSTVTAFIPAVFWPIPMVHGPSTMAVMIIMMPFTPVLMISMWAPAPAPAPALVAPLIPPK
jgi:hypothetical protein